MALLNMLQALLGQEGTDVSELTVPGGKSRFENPDLMPIADTSNDGSFVQQPQFNPSKVDPGMQQTVQPDAAQNAQPTGINYNNSQQARDVNGALAGEPTPRGGSANPGIYGLLPQRMQHGTLRNILGALGDALLVGGGHEAAYGPRMERQEIGNAMAGYNPDDPESVRAAIQRIAATGATGSTEMADKLQKSANDSDAKKQAAEQLAIYRENLNLIKQESMINRMTLSANSDLGRATSAADYQARLERWDRRIKAINKDMDAVTALGVPAEYDPTVVNPLMGVTGNQVIQHQDRSAQRDVSERNSQRAAGSRVQAAGIMGGAHIAGANIYNQRPSDALRREELGPKIDAGTATGAEQTEWNHLTQTGRGRRGLPASVPVHSPQPFINDHLYTDKHGNVRKYKNGQWLQP